MNPDSHVEDDGEPLTLTRVTDYSVGMDGATSVTREVLNTKGIVSNPSEEQSQRLEGRLESGAITITVPSDLDVEADRDGGRDRIVRPATSDVETEISGQVYTVSEVIRDKHPAVGAEKVTLACNVYDVKDLSDDADTYQYL